MNEKDLTRIKEYRQIRKEIRRSDKYLVVGIDVGKEKHYAYYGTSNGKTLQRRLVFWNTFGDIEMMMDHANAIKEGNGPEKVVYGVEPTTNYHKLLSEYLMKR